MWQQQGMMLAMSGQIRLRQGDGDMTRRSAFVADSSASTAGRVVAVAGSLATACELAQD